MALESFSFITSLNASNPVHATDDVSVGDDHLRGLKSTLLATFPNADAAYNFTPTEANLLVGATGLTGTGKTVRSIAPTFTGVLNAAGGIVASTFGGIVSSDLVDKGVTEVITGEWTFSDLIGGVMVATSYDGVAAANLLDKSATELVTGAWEFTIGPELKDVELGHATDTTITRRSAGLVEVEGRPIIAHEDTAFVSGKIFVETGNPTGGANGDIWFKREA